MNLGRRHSHKFWKVDDEENGAARCQCGVPCAGEVVTGVALDIIALNKLLDILEDSNFPLGLDM
jgi:hypothetical protein